jgi:ABC-type polysaccharide transport system permease subunit
MIDIKKCKRHWQLYLLLLPPIIYLILFHYIPMLGVQIAFKDYNLAKGIIASPWVGFKHFISFITSYQFSRLIINTMGISIYQITAGFAPPILLALALNYASRKHFAKSVQLITYMPHFISTVLIVAIIFQVLSFNGLANNILRLLGEEPIHFLGDPGLFKSIYVWSGIWQNTGYNAIIYLAVISSINPELYEAAIVDGASIWRRIWHIDIPSIMPTATILLILSTARILNVGFEKVYLLQNPMNMQTSDIISTYVYRVGLVSMQYSYSAAIGLFQSLVSLVLITTVNGIARKTSENSLW